MQHLVELITKIAQEYRMTPEVTVDQTDKITVVEIYMMPHIDEAPPGLEMVNMWFIKVGVNKALAEEHRAEIVSLISEWPDISKGLSYIHFGGLIGSQDLALMLMAIGKVLGFWEIVTPELFGDRVTNDEKDRLAGMGFVMADGFKPNPAPPQTA
jgi:hypothetical protein